MVSISFTDAPFTLRMAISLRRCSQLSVMKEKIPKAAMSTQISRGKAKQLQ